MRSLQSWDWIHRKTTWTLFGCCVVGFLFAVWYRMLHLEYVQVYSDSLSPFVAACKVFYTGWSDPPNPESDHWLWVSSLPLVLLAENLEQLFLFRLVVGASIVPVGCAVLWGWDSPNKLLGMVLMAVLLSVDAGLIDTLISSFRGYGAPEIFAVATLGYVFWAKGQAWGAYIASIFTVIAAGQHPLALGCLLAVFVMWKQIYHSSPALFWKVLGTTFVFSLPRVLWIIELMQCDSGGFSCLQQIALSSSETESVVQLLWRIVHDRFWIEQGVGGGLLLLGCLLGRKHPFASWVLWSTLGIVVLGLSISTLRPYHFRVLAVPMLCWSLLGWLGHTRILLLLSPLWAWGYVMQSPEPVAWRNVLSEHDSLASALCEQQKPFWLEAYDPSGELAVSIQGIGISMALQGCQKQILSQPKERIVLLSEQELSYPIISQVEQYKMYELSTSQLQEEFSSEALLSGFDVATIFYADSEIVLHW